MPFNLMMALISEVIIILYAFPLTEKIGYGLYYVFGIVVGVAMGLIAKYLENE